MSEKLSLLHKIRENKNSKESTSFNAIIMRFIRNWKWFVLGFLVALCLGFLYLRIATPTYKVSSSLIMKDTWYSGSPSENIDDQLNFALSGGSTNVANELLVMQSQTLIRKVINKLNLHTSYFVKNRFKETDLYTNSPVIVSMNQNDLDTLSQRITLNIEMIDQKNLKVSGLVNRLSFDTIFTKLPVLLPTPAGNISFSERKGTSFIEKPIRVEIQNPYATTKMYRAKLSINPASEFAFVLNLSLLTPSPSKGKDFLNMLVEIYNNESIQDNKMETVNTQAFINERIQIINEYIVEVEQDVEEYKSEHGLTHFQSDVKRNMQAGDKYEQQLVQIGTQLDIVNSLNEYVNDSKNANKTIPSNLGITDAKLADAMLAATTNEYNQLLIERKRLSKSMTEDNPVLIKLNEQISGLHKNIVSFINSVQQGLNIQRRDALKQANLYGIRISNIPTQEKEFKGISRDQQLKTSLFLTLLQMREENALLLAAMSNNAKVLDEPMLEGKVAPRSMIVLLIALLLGVLIPSGIISLIDMLQYKIQNRADVDRITQVPILAEIPHYKGEGSIAVKENETKEIDEAFRLARTNLMLNLDPKNKVVIFTSTVSGEGKTFIAINTAVSMALLNKKVLLVGIDLRIPRIKEYMNLKTDDGLTLFLSGFESKIDNLIVPSVIHPNLDVLPAGPIPPNPAELLTRSTLDNLFATLREKYDYIFIDSAPSAQVTDTLIINRVSDATVYVCRANYSSKANIRFANELMQKGKLNNMLLVINEVSEYQISYGYGYGEKGKNNKRTKIKNIINARS